MENLLYSLIRGLMMNFFKSIKSNPFFLTLFYLFVLGALIYLYGFKGSGPGKFIYNEF
jgi:hypothetical protein